MITGPVTDAYRHHADLHSRTQLRHSRPDAVCPIVTLTMLRVTGRSVSGDYLSDADEDDRPAVGPEGPDEQDRILLDDFEPRGSCDTSITLLQYQDQFSLVTDNSVIVPTAVYRPLFATNFATKDLS